MSNLSDSISRKNRDPILYQNELKPVITVLKNNLEDDLMAIILFGSQARGDARPESDWDLLLLARNLPASLWKRQQKIQTLLPPQWRHQVNILAHTPAEWFNRVTPLALDIATDGLILYEKVPDSVSSRLLALRAQLQQLGLERQQLEAGEWLWLWRDEPQPQWQLEWT